MNKHFIGKHCFHGTTTVGQRGQIVIPSQARKKLKLKAGDQLAVFGHGPMLHVIKLAEVDKLFAKLSKKINQNLKELRTQIKKDK